jgi:hypothetical protein
MGTGGVTVESAPGARLRGLSLNFLLSLEGVLGSNLAWLTSLIFGLSLNLSRLL